MEKNMKRIHTLFVATALVLMVSACASNKVADKQLPKSVGENPFAGNSYSDERTKFDFNSDGSLLISMQNPQTKKWESQSRAKYSWNEAEKQLNMQMTSIFDNDTELVGSDIAATAILNESKEQIESTFEGIEVSEATKKTLEEYYNESIKIKIDSYFSKIETYKYSLGEDGSLTLEAPLETGLSSMQQLMGQDSSMKYNISIQSTELTIVSSDTDEGNPSIYLGNVIYNDAAKSFESALYKLEQTLDGEDGKVISEKFSKVGKLKASYTVSEAELLQDYASENLFPYSLTYTINFTSLPKDLSDLKGVEIHTHTTTGWQVFNKVENN